MGKLKADADDIADIIKKGKEKKAKRMKDKDIGGPRDFKGDDDDSSEGPRKTRAA